MISLKIEITVTAASKFFTLFSKLDEIKKYFFSSSACAYNKDLQNETTINGLKESDAYPANPEDGYGWEKLFSERMCRHFF